jgi:hypothetical protein
MKMYSLININSVTAVISQGKARNNKAAIERLAQSIIEMNGDVIAPCIVKRTGYDADGCPVYELIAGELVYLAYTRAAQMDSSITNMSAVIVTPENERAIQEQLSVFSGV